MMPYCAKITYVRLGYKEFKFLEYLFNVVKLRDFITLFYSSLISVSSVDVFWERFC